MNTDAKITICSSPTATSMKEWMALRMMTLQYSVC